MKDLAAPQCGFVLSHPNNIKTYTFFCKSVVEKQTWMAELVSMVLPNPTNKPTGSFIKSGSFHPSRPPAQTIVNRPSATPTANNIHYDSCCCILFRFIDWAHIPL
jgi:hypothetical protein